MSDSLQPQGLLQARILEWVAGPSSKGSSQPRIQTQVSCIAGRFFTSWATREAQVTSKLTKEKKLYLINTWEHGMAEIILHIYRKTLDIIWLTCHLSLHWLLKFHYLCWYHPMSTHSIKYQHRKHNTYLFRVNLLKTSAFDKEKKPSAHFQLFVCTYQFSSLWAWNARRNDVLC